MALSRTWSPLTCKDLGPVPASSRLTNLERSCDLQPTEASADFLTKTHGILPTMGSRLLEFGVCADK